MKKLNILIISRSIIPKNSPRAFRATELATELARQGHSVTLYSILGNYDYSEYEGETGVKVKNMGKMLFATHDSDGGFRYTLLDKILYHSLHRLIEFPDIELMFRVPAIIRKEKEMDLLITIASPHAIHWGGALARTLIPASKFPKTWVADCGDPYMGNSIENNKFSYFKYVEKWWGRKVDYITIPLEEGKTGYYREFHSKIKIIPQGFDFSKVKLAQPYVRNDIPTFAYAGTIYPKKRDPKSFLNFLVSLEQDFRFVIYTRTPNYYSVYKKKLQEKLVVKSYIPRDQLIFELSQMDFLINLKNPDRVQSPSKMIDYLLSQRPILNISSDFSAHERNVFLEFVSGDYVHKLENSSIDQYNIQNVALKFVDLCNEH
jgi:hypothetical protein